MALVIRESGCNPKARRHEPDYQRRYVTGKPRWDEALLAYRAGNCYNCRYAENVLSLRDRIKRGEPV